MIRVFMIGFSSNKGGVEAYITNLSDSLDHSYFEIIYQLPEMLIDGRIWTAPKNRHNYIKYCLFWKRFFRENHFDVLYLNTCDIVSIDPLIFAKQAGVPVRIIHSHSSGNQQSINSRMSLFHRISEKHSRKILDKYATHLFACSQSAGNKMFGNRDYIIIKNGIKLSKYLFDPIYRDTIRERYSLKTPYIVGVIGRLDPVKNPIFACEILETAIKKRNDISAVFIGDGELRGNLEAYIAERNLGDRIKLIGAVDNVNEWMSAVDCILMPSLFEGLPFVLVEAQAAGLHCVVSSSVSDEADITGLVEFVNLDDGKEVWADKVINACNQPRADVSQNLIDAGYSIEDSAKKVSSLIDYALFQVK